MNCVSKMEKVVIQAMGMHSLKYGGLEKYMVVLINELRRRGYKTVLVYNKLPAVERYVNDLRDVGAEIELVSKDVGFIEQCLRFNKIIRKYNPEVVHAHFLPRIPMLVSKLNGIQKRFVTVHSLLENSVGNVLLSKNDIPFKSKVFMRIFDTIPRKVFTVSHQVERQLQIIYPKSVKIENVYLGVHNNNNRRDYARRLLKIPNQIIVLSNISFDSSCKAIDTLLQAIALLKHQYKIKNFKLIHFGIEQNSDSGEKWRKYCRALDIEDSVIWYGITNQLNELLPAIDVYIHPSRAEALGLVVLEAGAASVPSVVSNIGGMKEVVNDGISGIVCEVDNAQNIAEAIVRLIYDVNKRKQMGEEARKIVEQKFNISKQALMMVEKYL